MITLYGDHVIKLDSGPRNHIAALFPYLDASESESSQPLASFHASPWPTCSHTIACSRVEWVAWLKKSVTGRLELEKKILSLINLIAIEGVTT